VVAAVIESSTPDGLDEPESLLVGLLGICGLAGSFMGVGLGIGGLVQRDRNRLFSLLGTAFNGLIILGTLLLVVIGLMMPS
jgi:hypothetical protein